MTTAAELDDRYGRTPRPAVRRTLWALLGVAVVVVVGYFGWVTVQGANAVSVDGLGYRVIDEHTVEVRFQFSAHQGADVRCALKALDQEFGVIGWKIVDFPATDSHAQVASERVRTLAPGNTGLVEACWVA